MKKLYPKEMVKYGLMGSIEALKVAVVFAKATDNKEHYIKVLEDVIKNIGKDLKEVE